MAPFGLLKQILADIFKICSMFHATKAVSENNDEFSALTWKSHQNLSIIVYLLLYLHLPHLFKGFTTAMKVHTGFPVVVPNTCCLHFQSDHIVQIFKLSHLIMIR